MNKNSSNDQIEEITKIVLQVINSEKESNIERKGILAKIFQGITSNRVVFSLFIGIITSVIGLYYFEISPFYKLEEISNRQKNLEYNKKIVRWHLKLGNSFLGISQMDAAKIEFEKAIVLDKYNVEAHFGKMKSEVFIPIGNKEPDLEIVEKKLNLYQKEYPFDPHIYSFLGDVYLNIDKDKAMEYYMYAVDCDSKTASAYYGMAVIHDMDEDSVKAHDMYLKASSLSKLNQTYLNNLGYQYYQRGNYDQAIEYYKKLLSLNGNYALTHFPLSSAYRLKGNLWYSFQYYEFLIDLLNNDEIMAQNRNIGLWFFHTDREPIYFYELSMKKCYAYYGIALTAYLRSDFMTADHYIDKAKNLKSEREWLVKRLLSYDIKTLRNFQKSYSDRLDSFVAEYGI